MTDDPRKIARVAAGMAISNYGHLGGSVPVDRVTDTRWSWSTDAFSEVCNVAGNIIESDEHEEMFGDEAEGWEKQIREVGLEAFAERFSYHSWIRTIIDADLSHMRT